MKITKFTKTANFTIIRLTSYNINEIYSKGYREVPSTVTRIAKIMKFTKIRKNYENYEIYENCEIYDNSLDLQGSPIESYENCENYEIYKNCEIYENSKSM